MAVLGRVQVAEVPEWTYARSKPSKYTFFAALAVAGLEDRHIRLNAATQRALLGAPVFGRRVLRVDSKTGMVQVMSSTCFGTDINSGDYPPSIVQFAADQKKACNPGFWGDVYVPAELLQS